MGMWPGDEFLLHPPTPICPSTSRCCADPVGQGPVGLQGRALPDGRLPPEPAAAGRHEGDLRRARATPAWDFSARYADYNFCFGKGREHPQGLRAPLPKKLIEATKADRPPCHDLRAGDGDRRRDGRGSAAPKWGALQGGRRSRGDRVAGWARLPPTPGPAPTPTVRQDGRPDLRRQHQHGHGLVGSYASVARHASTRMAEVAGPPRGGVGGGGACC